MGGEHVFERLNEKIERNGTLFEKELVTQFLEANSDTDNIIAETFAKTLLPGKSPYKKFRRFIYWW